MEEKSATRAVADLASRQHGVVAGKQLAAYGWGGSKISREVKAGRLHRLHPGVFAVGHEAITEQGRALAAVLGCGPDAHLSHLSAARLWGISAWPPRIPEVVTTRSVRHARSDIRIHSSRTLQADDRAVEQGVPVTAVSRTLLNLAGSARGNVRWALPRARKLGLLDLVAIDGLLERSRGLRGVARLRLAVERYRTRAFTRSDLELEFREVVKRAGLPPPAMNRFVEGFELDAYWDDLRFAVELDTYDYHGDEISFEEDRLRHEDLKLAGIEMIRVTGQRMDREPHAVARRLRRLLDQRRTELGRDEVDLPISSAWRKKSATRPQPRASERRRR